MDNKHMQLGSYTALIDEAYNQAMYPSTQYNGSSHFAYTSVHKSHFPYTFVSLCQIFQYAWPNLSVCMTKSFSMHDQILKSLKND